MSLKISDEELKQGRSGSMLRFQVHFGIDAANEVMMSVKGFLAFRQTDGSLKINPPLMTLTLYGKKIKYRNVEISPKATEAIADYIEAQWGKKLKGDPDWQGSRQELHDKQKQEGWDLR